MSLLGSAGEGQGEGLGKGGGRVGGWLFHDYKQCAVMHMTLRSDKFIKDTS